MSRTIGDHEEYFDEVGNWLRKKNFSKYTDVCNQKNIKTLKELSQKMQRSDIKKVKIINGKHDIR